MMNDTVAYLRDCFAYDRWANERAIESIRPLAGDDARDALRLMAHIIAAQGIWHARVAGPPGTHERFPDWSLDECAARGAELHERWLALLGGERGDPDRLVSYTTLAGQEMESSLRDICTHVNNHGTYHRGQIARCVVQAGGTALATDFIAYAQSGRPVR